MYRTKTSQLRRQASEVTGGPEVTPLVLRVSMGGGDRLPSGDPSARLPSYHIKKS